MISYKKLQKIPNTVALLVIRFYRHTFSPSTGILRFLPFYPKHTCIFYPTCSEYGEICFKKYPFGIAFKKTSSRIARCHPGNEPRVDQP